MMSSSRNLLLCKTFSLCVSFFILGLCIAIPGPTILDMMKNLNVDIAGMSTVYVWRAVGCLFGTIVGGILLDRYNRTFLIFLNLLITAVCFASMPWFKTMWLFSAVAAIAGATTGLIDTGVNVLCLDMWGDQSGPYFQALHFSFGVGSFVAPVLATPFLEQQVEDIELNDFLNTNQSLIPFTERIPNINIINDTPIKNFSSTEDVTTVATLVATNIENTGISQLQILYLIVGLIVLAVALLFLGFLLYDPSDPKSSKEENTDSKHKVDRKTAMVLVGLMSLFYFLYVGLELAFGQLITVYCVKSVFQMSKSNGSYMAAVYWAFYTTMRFIIIFGSRYIKALTILIFELTLCIAGAYLLLIFGDKVEWVLWLGTALLGAGFASLFPSGMLWVENYIEVTNKVASCFIVGVSLGAMICPFVVGTYMDTTPMMLIYAVALGVTLCVITFVFTWYLASRQGEKHGLSSSPGYRLASQNNEDETTVIQKENISRDQSIQC